MKMFIILLVFVFTLFFLGGSLLFDSGIADSKGITRIPVAVQVEKTYFEVRKQTVFWIKKILLVADSYYH